MNLEFTRLLFEKNQKTVEDVQAAIKPYSMDELMEKAKEMYNFVTNKE